MNLKKNQNRIDQIEREKKGVNYQLDADQKKMIISDSIDKMFNVFMRRLKAYSQEDFQEFVDAKENAQIQLSKM